MAISTTFTLKFSGSAVEKGLARVQSAFKSLGGVVLKIGKSLVSPFAGLAALLGAGGIVAGMTSLIKSSSDAAANMEDLTMQFEVLTKSAKITKGLLADFKDEAAKSPLSIDDYAKAGKTLMAFGMDAKDVMPVLKNLGDVSMGNSDRFGSLALAFAQTQAAGRLMGQEVLQFVNAGFNPLQQISKKTGESMVQLKKRMEDGAISSREVAQAFKEATSKGGLFFGAIQRGADTTTGKMAKVKDDILNIKIAFGTGFNEGLRDALDAMSRSIPKMKDLAIEMGKTVGRGMTHLVDAFEQGRLTEVIQASLMVGVTRAGEEMIAAMVFAGNALYDTIAERMKGSDLGKLMNIGEPLNEGSNIPKWAMATPFGQMAYGAEKVAGLQRHFTQSGGSVDTYQQTREGFRNALDSSKYAEALNQALQPTGPHPRMKGISYAPASYHTNMVDEKGHRIMFDIKQGIDGLNQKLAPQP